MTSIHIQSVIYKNEKKSLFTSIESVDNAVRVARDFFNMDLSIVFHYGDAGPEPIFDDEDVKKLNEIMKNISLKYSFFNDNTGSAKGHNILAKECSSDYIMMMNPDVKLSPHFFFYILAPFSYDNVGMVEARQSPIEHQKEYDYITLQTEWATTACAIVRTDIFNQLNGFDAETFFLYCDDLDFSWRLRLLGFVIIYQPLAPVYHSKHLTKNGKWIPTASEKYYSAESALLMAYKWSNPERVSKLLNEYSSSNN